MRETGIFSEALQPASSPDRIGTVLKSTPFGVDVELSSGEVLRRLPLAGATKAGTPVRLRYVDGSYTVLGDQSSVAGGGSSFVSTSSGSGGSGGDVSVHDFLGSLHTLPSVSAGQVLAGPASSTGLPSFRAIVLSDIQSAADTRYVPLTRTLTGGDGINAIGDLSVDRTISVDYGAGLTMLATELVLGTPSALSISTTDLVTGTTHTHSVLHTTTGASSTLVATNPGGDIYASRHLVASGGTVQSLGTTAALIFQDRAPGLNWSWYSASSIAHLNYNGTDKLAVSTAGNLTMVGNITETGIVTMLGSAAALVFDDQTNSTTQAWKLYADNGLVRLYRSGADRFSVDGNGYAVATRFGAGVTSPSNALHGRSGSNQLRLDVDASAYALLSVSGAGVLSIVPSGNLIVSNNYQYNGTFFSGFAGAGWRMDYGLSRSGAATLELDDLVVRGRMRVYELLITKIRSVNGNLFISSNGKIKTASLISGASYALSAGSNVPPNDDPPHNFEIGDLIRAQKFTGTGVYQSNMQVTAVADLYSFTATLVSGDAPAAGMDFVRLGSATDSTRRGSLYLAADDSGSPFMDVIDEVASFADWGSPAKNKLRLGNLSGVSDSFWGALTGYGIYTQYGYFRNVKINGSAIIGSSVAMSLAAALYVKGDTAPNSFVPNTNGHLGQAAVVTGGVSGHPIGPFAGAGALVIAEGTTNLLINPRFANASAGTGYTSGGNATASLSSNALFGTTALQVAFTGTGNRYIAGAVTRTSTSNPLSVGVWVMSTSGTAQVAIGIWNAGLTASSVGATVTVGDQWTYITHTALAAALPSPTFGTTVNVLVYNDYDNGTNKTIIVGAMQAEEKAFSTPIVTGDMGAGHAWAGTAHQSLSSRIAAGLTYTPSGNMPTVSGSAGGWFWAGANSSGTNAGNRVIFHSDTGPFLVLRVNPSNQLEGWWGGRTLTSTGTVTLRAWNHAMITSDGATVRLYLNGVQVASGSYNGPIGMSNIYVGSYQGAQQWLNGMLGDLVITDRTLTSDEVLMTARANAPLTISRSNFELVLAEPGLGKIVGNAGGLYATTPNNVNSFMLLNSLQNWNGENLPAGSMLLGNNHATTGSANLLYNAGTGALLIRNKQVPVISLLSTANGLGQIATFDGVIGISASGGIWQGSAGTFAAPQSGFKLYSTSGKAVWETWLSSTRQVYIESTDMSLRAGAGNVILDGTGIRLRTAAVLNAYASTSALRFTDSNDTALFNLQAYSTPTGDIYSRYISDPTWATQSSSFTLAINSALGGQLEISTAGTTSFQSAAIYMDSSAGGFGGWIRLAGAAVRIEAADTFWGNNRRLVHGNAVWQPTSGTSISTGTTTVDYTPSLANWTAFSGTFANLVLNGLNYTAIAFHDAGTRVDVIRVGAGVMDIGYDAGWGSPAVKINNPRFSFGGPASSAAAGTQGDVRVDGSFVYVCTATNTWKRAALSTF